MNPYVVSFVFLSSSRTDVNMSFVPYVPDTEIWKQLLNHSTLQKFYPLQKGKGSSSSINVVSPQEGILERAKSELKNQINNANPRRGSQSILGIKGGRIVKKKKKAKPTVTKGTQKKKKPKTKIAQKKKTSKATKKKSKK